MKTFLATACAALYFATSATAGSLPEPNGDVLLTISGEIQNEPRDGVILLDRDMLEAMPKVQFTTSTIWTETPVEFTGVSLRHVLDHAGFEGSNIEAVALNDYKVEIPASNKHFINRQTDKPTDQYTCRNRRFRQVTTDQHTFRN